MLVDLCLEALRNLRAHWLRFLLTASGIVWGVALFVIMIAIGQANREHYREKLAVIGRNAVWVFPGKVTRRGEGERSVRNVELDRDDPPRLPESPRISHAEAELWAQPRVLKGGGHIKVVWAVGTGPQAGRIRNYQIGEGRFLTPGDVAQRRRVLILGAKVAERLFGRQSALGRQVRLDGHPFRVVGVSKAKGEQLMNMGPRDDEQVLLPISVAQTLFTQSDKVDFLLFEPSRREDAAAAISRTRMLLGQHHRFTSHDEEAVSFFNVADSIALISGMLSAISIFLAACGVLTLAAGAVGVMNIMLVAVAERTREIGIRKALGATHRALFVQLMIETTMVTVGAGAFGMLLGYGVIRGLQIAHDLRGGSDLLMPRIEFSAGLALLAFVVLVGAGLFASLLPALRGARLEPAVALRDE
ncbi:MAG: ABC transporter permease [Deltaproteobacteria bacterium]|nr:ABC transporter permease [Deltaproteobacteria bacterium]